MPVTMSPAGVRPPFDVRVANSAKCGGADSILGPDQPPGSVRRADRGHPSTGLPGEMRLIAMQNTKLRQLSANTTSNQDNAALAKHIPDLLNPLGNQIARRWVTQNPFQAARLSAEIGETTTRRRVVHQPDHLADPVAPRSPSRKACWRNWPVCTARVR